MLRIDLRAARDGPVATVGTIPADDPLFADIEFVLGRAVDVTGRLMESGPGRYYWHAGLRSRVDAVCRRCLAPVAVEIAQDVRVLFTEDARAEDPAAYVIPSHSVELDLGGAVWEELILAVPPYVLCREDCRGLCARCGADLNEGPCACRPEADPRWAALESLRARLIRNED